MFPSTVFPDAAPGELSVDRTYAANAAHRLTDNHHLLLCLFILERPSGQAPNLLGELKSRPPGVMLCQKPDAVLTQVKSLIDGI
jgi:hypothetical protein